MFVKPESLLARFFFILRSSFFYYDFMNKEQQSPKGWIEVLRAFQGMVSAFDRRTIHDILVVSVSALVLIIIHYYAIDPGAVKLIREMQHIGLDNIAGWLEFKVYYHPQQQLWRLGYWVLILVLAYFFIPLLVIKTLFKSTIRVYGFLLPASWKSMRIYLIMLVLMVPLVWVFSQTRSFQLRYPFYHLTVGEALWPYFWIWQGLYLLQFLALEFFFRGFMVHGLKRRFGNFSVLIMIIPYCMIHFGKPMPEAFAAVFAGLILGFLSLKTNSVLPGVLLHYGVALTMDLMALYYAGYF